MRMNFFTLHISRRTFLFTGLSCNLTSGGFQSHHKLRETTHQTSECNQGVPVCERASAAQWLRGSRGRMTKGEWWPWQGKVPVLSCVTALTFWLDWLCDCVHHCDRFPLTDFIKFQQDRLIGYAVGTGVVPQYHLSEMETHPRGSTLLTDGQPLPCLLHVYFRTTCLARVCFSYKKWCLMASRKAKGKKKGFHCSNSIKQI